MLPRMTPDRGPVAPPRAGFVDRPHRPAPLGWALVGYAAISVVFEGLGRLTAGLDTAPGMALVAAVVLGVTLGAELLLGRGTPRQALGRLGLGRPAPRALLAGAVIGGLLVAFLPLLLRLTGVTATLPPHWPLLALAIFAMNGVAEEAVYRGYLFRYLRQGRGFWHAVLLGMALHALAHLPILATAGVAVWLGASFTALATFGPLAYLYERGRNTIWAPALVHFAIDTVKLVVTAELVATSAGLTAIGIWMVAASVAPYLAFALLRGDPSQGTASARA
jgi:membrane protease YdiL (CAAX protease family)